MKRSFLTLLSFAILTAVFLSECAFAEKIVAVLPFKVSADRDLSYLSSGLQEMLSTRLFHPNETRVIPKEAVSKEISRHGVQEPQSKAREIGASLGAEYVISGGITVLGNSFSLDAIIHPIREGAQGFTLSTQGKRLDDIILEMDKFSQEINARLFGKTVASKVPEQEEKAIKEEVGQEEWRPNPAFKGFKYGLDQKNYWRSRGFSEEISGLDIGDVDGDGQNEVVVSVKDRVEVYKFKEKRLTKFAEYELGDKVPIISLDVADLNKNNRAEIFLSRVSRGGVSSMVLEFGAGRLFPVQRDLPYLLRAMEVPPHGKILLGQEMSGSTGEVEVDLIKAHFGAGIKRLEWNGREFAAAGELSIPAVKGLFIYNFAIGDMDGDGSVELIMLDNEERLNVFSAIGERLFRSSEPYGATMNFIRLNPEKEASSISRVRLQMDDIYLPSRMLLADIDGDGKKELILARNTNSSPYTSRYRSYSDGKIVLLSWNGMSMDPVWETRRLTGCVSDLQIRDLDGDGNLDLVLALIQETGVSVVKDARSVVVGYALMKQK